MPVHRALARVGVLSLVVAEHFCWHAMSAGAKEDQENDKGAKENDHVRFVHTTADNREHSKRT